MVGEVIDLAYLMLVEKRERQVLADRQSAFVLLALGRRDPDEPLPDVGVERARLDAALAAEPAVLEHAGQAEREQMQLRRALGVAR